MPPALSDCFTMSLAAISWDVVMPSSAGSSFFLLETSIAFRRISSFVAGLPSTPSGVVIRSVRLSRTFVQRRTSSSKPRPFARSMRISVYCLAASSLSDGIRPLMSP